MYLYQRQHMQFPPPAQVHPFVFKLVTGNIRICQSCRSSLREVDERFIVPHMISMCLE